MQIDQADKATYDNAAEVINQESDTTIVIVQHEYGIYGGDTGVYLLDFLSKLNCPVVTTLHTVVENPTDKMRLVTEGLIEGSDRLVALTDTSFRLFGKIYPTAKNKLVHIKHGIHPLLYRRPDEMKGKLKLTKNRVILTFGLLSRNKGIEFIISAMPAIVDQFPNAVYFVLGATHPGVLRAEGESYRLELMALVKKLHLGKHIKFIDDFLPVQEILEYLQASDIYIATSLDPQQAVSGTLSYALGTGRAVIATSFSQAKEIVRRDVGRIVPIKDSTAVSKAVLELFNEPELLESMNQNAYARTRSMLWTNVADSYVSTICEVAEQNNNKFERWPEFNWQYLEKMTDKFGMLQFAVGVKPEIRSGYTLDDNSRALQTANFAYELGLIPKRQYDNLARKYLHVISQCLSNNPPVNYLSAKTLQATRQNFSEDLSDSMARAYYALQTTRQVSSPAKQHLAEEILEIMPVVDGEIKYIRSAAQVLLGAAFALRHGDETKRDLVNNYASYMVKSYIAHSTETWHWFDSVMTYANGQLSCALLEAARSTGNKEYRSVAIDSLDYLLSCCFMGDVYTPIGQSGWHNKDGARALFDQQPEDAFSMLHALESAYYLTNDSKYLAHAEKVFSWFMGNNLVGLRLYDDVSGGCHDGLMPTKVNCNEGAESSISYLAARIIIEKLKLEN